MPIPRQPRYISSQPEGPTGTLRIRGTAMPPSRRDFAKMSARGLTEVEENVQ
jgi:hypothetical protein